MNILSNKAIRDLDIESMEREVLEIKRALFDFRLKQATRQSVKPHIIKAYKNQLARIMTIQKEKYFNQ
jgi:ribosomal protein L29|uniref:Large ribosomal subunit protein uL29c n=1 Tax=Palmaria decipiens TaxID=187399 RepID=A0A6C0W2C0_PALDE|nr:50S ribosomal protein L29 [Palmaria decipiens]QIC19530.1 50S ribosomal protein L29 [Palmaria decipiens]